MHTKSQTMIYQRKRNRPYRLQRGGCGLSSSLPLLGLASTKRSGMSRLKSKNGSCFSDKVLHTRHLTCHIITSTFNTTIRRNTEGKKGKMETSLWRVPPKIIVTMEVFVFPWSPRVMKFESRLRDGAVSGRRSRSSSWRRSNT